MPRPSTAPPATEASLQQRNWRCRDWKGQAGEARPAASPPFAWRLWLCLGSWVMHKLQRPSAAAALHPEPVPLDKHSVPRQHPRCAWLMGQHSPCWDDAQGTGMVLGDSCSPSASATDLLHHPGPAAQPEGNPMSSGSSCSKGSTPNPSTRALTACPGNNSSAHYYI